MPSSRAAAELALTTLLRRKGRILDSLVDNVTTLRAHLTPALRDQLDELTQARGELVARLHAAASAPLDTAAIAEIRARIENLEASLSAASAEFRTREAPVSIAAIQAALPPGGALVEFVLCHRFAPAQLPRRWQDARYVAYLITPQGPPDWVVLGGAAAIDAEIDAVLAAMHGQASPQATTAALKRLDAMVFAPIRGRLAGVSHAILAPDGKLNLVPFEALVDSQGRHALEKHLVSYVTTGRDLLRLVAPMDAQSPAVLVAGPDYGPPPSQAGAPSFAPLPGALAEAEDLKGYFPTPPLTGAGATKAALAALAGPAMLHIATHGFFARDVPTSAPAHHPTRDIVLAQGAPSLALPPSSDDPADGLDRAGIAMAGANQGAHGIVTARELAGFDWWGTQLVVLSACETGVGAMPSGDGVYGLRRALVLAGAASQVVSLWSVSDSSAPALMREYYRELACGTGRAEALRRAKLHMLRQPHYAHPYYWAAFIPAGDWAPLRQRLA
jgi:CHAT domain-containing protein